jgi:hypothetical protein
MRREFLWLVLLVFSIDCLTVQAFSLMVSCAAPGCSWEKATTDARGLSRHRATCRFHLNSRILACNQRQDRAKQAARTLSLRQPLAAGAGSHSSGSMAFNAGRVSSLSNEVKSHE